MINNALWFDWFRTPRECRQFSSKTLICWYDNFVYVTSCHFGCCIDIFKILCSCIALPIQNLKCVLT
jgi:hypothetical protein